VLWGLDPNPAANRVTLHRVRTALGYPEAILEDHHSYRLAPEVLEASDLYDFYRDIAEARRAGSQGERLKAYRRANRSYSGDYLPQLATNRVGQAHEEQRAAYVRVLLEVALVHLGQRDWHPAADFLRRAVYTDPKAGEPVCPWRVSGAPGSTEHPSKLTSEVRPRAFSHRSKPGMSPR
jgi:two-component SAPR family response regulator